MPKVLASRKNRDGTFDFKEVSEALAREHESPLTTSRLPLAEVYGAHVGMSLRELEWSVRRGENDLIQPGVGQTVFYRIRGENLFMSRLRGESGEYECPNTGKECPGLRAVAPMMEQMELRWREIADKGVDSFFESKWASLYGYSLGSLICESVDKLINDPNEAAGKPFNESMGDGIRHLFEYRERGDRSLLITPFREYEESSMKVFLEACDSQTYPRKEKEAWETLFSQRDWKGVDDTLKRLEREQPNEHWAMTRELDRNLAQYALEFKHLLGYATFGVAPYHPRTPIASYLTLVKMRLLAGDKK